jgi:mono/diheme cytochrome c family protein
MRASAAAAAVAWSVSCAGGGCLWFVNMGDQPSVRPLEERPLATIDGTVPAGAALPPAITFEAAQNLTSPVPPDDASRERGRALFDTYCLVCHGPEGAGDGPVTAKFVRPPNLRGASRGFTDGYLYALITNGRGNMPSYNRLAPAERWDVIHYLRALQGAAPAAAAAGAAGAAAPTGAPAGGTPSGAGAARPGAAGGAAPGAARGPAPGAPAPAEAAP